MDERDYGTPPPAAVIHDNVFRPFDAFSSSKAVISPNELFEKLQSKYMAPKRPGVLGRINGYAWHTSEEGIVTRLEDSSEGSIKLQSPSIATEESLDKTSSSSVRPDTSYSKYSNVSDDSDDSNKTQDSAQVAGNSTRDRANISSVTQKVNSSNFDLKLVQVISKPKPVRRSLIAHRLQDFRRQWLRQRRARVDWQSIIKPCNDNMAWGQVNDGWSKLNRSSTVASEVVFWDIRPAGEFSKIFIQSKTSDNRTKMIGGDSWRVYVRGPASVAATVFDHNNGTYEALFLIMEPGAYQVIIHLDYSLCDGVRDPPRDWFIKGNAQGKYQKEGILGTLDDYLRQPFKNGNPLIITVPETQLNVSSVGKYAQVNKSYSGILY